MAQPGSPHDQLYDPSTHSAVLEYLKWIDEHRCDGVTFESDSSRRRTFVPDTAIKQYFDLADRSNHGKEGRVTKLVTAAVAGSHKCPSPWDVARRCPKVFTILLMIGQAKYLDWFVKEDDLCDRRLPFRNEASSQFPILPSGKTFFDEFYKIQWQFCVEPLSYGSEPVKFYPDRILPIAEMRKINKKHRGATGVVLKVVVHQDYDQLQQTGSPESGHHEYVIKSYHHVEAEKYFYAEVGAFQKLIERSGQPVPNLIRFYGSFRQNDSFHVILEYANVGTLEDYFNKVQPPKLGEDIQAFWTGIFKLNHALAHIHNTSHSNNGHEPHVDGSPRIFQGWHQDIKPENILVSGDLEERPYEVRFMLADLGLSHFTAVFEHEDEVTGEDTGGSRAYSAPECYLANTPVSKFAVHVKQSIDTWSLACVYSEINAWVVEGVHGLKTYRSERLTEAESPGSPLGACFHNSKGELLRTVRDRHQGLLRRCATEDKVTEVLWDELLKYMFVPQENRLYARQVVAHADDEVIPRAALMLERTRRRDQAASPVSPSKDSSRPRTPPNVPGGWQERRPRLGNYSSDPVTLPSRDSMSKERHGLGINPASTSSYHPGFDTQATEGHRASLKSVQSDTSNSSTFYSPSGEHLSRPFTGGSHGVPIVSDGGQIGNLFHGQGPIPYRTNSASQGRLTVDLAQVWTLATQPPQAEQYTHNEFDRVVSVPDIPENEDKGKAAQRLSGITPKAQKPLKVLTRGELYRWAERIRAEKARRSHKLAFWSSPQYPLPFEGDWIDELRERDHIFVIDDGESMHEHWESLLSLYKDLVLLVKKKKLDPNGSELRFIRSDQHKEQKDTTDLITMVTAMGDKLRGESNFAARLDKIFEGYRKRLEKKPSSRSISLYVFTDGRWQTNMGQLEEVARAIKRMVEFLGKNWSHGKESWNTVHSIRP